MNTLIIGALIAFGALIWRCVYLSRQRNVFWLDLTLHIAARLQKLHGLFGLRIIPNHAGARHLNFELWRIDAFEPSVRFGRCEIREAGGSVPSATFFDGQERQLAHSSIFEFEEVMRILEQHIASCH